MKQVQSHLRTTFAQHQKETQPSQQPFLGPSMTPTRSSSGPVRRTVVTRVFEAVRALALCHNVTPVYEDSENSEAGYETEADQQIQQEVVYQASSPDEVSVRQRLIVSKRGFVCQTEALNVKERLFVSDRGPQCHERLCVYIYRKKNRERLTKLSQT